MYLMKALVISDTHGATRSLRKIFEAEQDYSYCIFLGDGERDLAPYFPRPDVTLLAVRGNCDRESSLPLRLTAEIGGKTLLLTHGKELHVKHDLSRLCELARDAGADIALFGHTHMPLQDHDDGYRDGDRTVLVFNPGSVYGSRKDRDNLGSNGSYAVLEITPQGVTWTPKYVE